MTDAILTRLEQIIKERAETSAELSYTKSLLEGGVKNVPKNLVRNLLN